MKKVILELLRLIKGLFVKPKSKSQIVKEGLKKTGFKVSDLNNAIDNAQSNKRSNVQKPTLKTLKKRRAKRKAQTIARQKYKKSWFKFKPKTKNYNYK